MKFKHLLAGVFAMFTMALAGGALAIPTVTQTIELGTLDSNNPTCVLCNNLAHEVEHDFTIAPYLFTDNLAFSLSENANVVFTLADDVGFARNIKNMTVSLYGTDPFGLPGDPLVEYQALFNTGTGAYDYFELDADDQLGAAVDQIGFGLLSGDYAFRVDGKIDWFNYGEYSYCLTTHPYDDGTREVPPENTVSEPLTSALMLGGLGMLGLARRKMSARA